MSVCSTFTPQIKGVARGLHLGSNYIGFDAKLIVEIDQYSRD